jgi:GT2 family glycosyltransferase/glycosyltransferase involved in cell wall biosynthesis
MSTQPKISVIIPTYNRAELLEQSLESLTYQKLPMEEFEVVVVNDGSTDATTEVCQNFKRKLNLVHCRTENVGISSAKSLGVFMSSAPICFFFDDDDLALPELLTQHLATHSQYPEENAAVLGYTAWAPNLEITPLMHYIINVGHFLFSYDHLRDGQHLDYSYFWGGRSSCKRSFLVRNGVFDQEFTRIIEDIELGYRLSKFGLYVIFNKKAVTHMIRPINLAEFLSRSERQGRAYVWFHKKHPTDDVLRYTGMEHAVQYWEFASHLFEAKRQRAEKIEEWLRKGVFTSSRESMKAHIRELYTHYEWLIRASWYKAFCEEKQKTATGEFQSKSQGGMINPEALPMADLEALQKMTSVWPRKPVSRGHVLVADEILPMHDRASGAHRMYQIMRILLSQGVHVTFIAREKHFVEQYLAPLQELGLEIHTPDPMALQAMGKLNTLEPYLDLPELLQRCPPDLAILSFWHVAEYYLPLIRKYSPSTLIAVDSVDLHFQREFREAQLVKKTEVNWVSLNEKRHREIAVYKQADELWVVTEADLKTIRPLVNQLPIRVVPNIHPDTPPPKSFESRQGLLFVGNFWHTPNQDAVSHFCMEILPLINKIKPGIPVVIAGNHPTHEIQQFASEQVTITGYVADLHPYLRKARISICPLRYGAGMKGKVGEALSWGLPVVTTSVGAEGMNLVDGEHALIADSPETFADAVVKLYEQKELWVRLSRNGRDLVETEWSPARIERQIQPWLTWLTRPRPTISIIMLVHNQWEDTLLCLQSLETYGTVTHEIVLVDNGSAEPTANALREYCQSHEQVILIRNSSNRGFAAGNNQGLSAARGEFCVLLNNDTVTTPGWLERLIAHFEEHPGAGIIGPMSNSVVGIQKVEAVGYQNLDELPDFATAWMSRHHGEFRRTPRVIGFCLAMRRGVFERIGGLDERFGNGNYEDDDYCLRANLAGFEVAVAGDVFIHHTGGRTFQGAQINYQSNMLRNWDLFKSKWGLENSRPIEAGYHPPTQPPPGLALNLPLKALSQTHWLDESRQLWSEKGIADSPSAQKDLPDVVQAGSLEKAESALQDGDLETAWHVTLAVMDKRPFHPAAWLLLAQIAEISGDYESARKIVQEALRFVPQSPLFRQKRKELSRKGTEGSRQWQLPLPSLVPVKTRLSVCLIVRNESARIQHCLDSIQSLATQIVVVDTGSEDDTRQIAGQKGAEIINFTWNDDFSAARNQALELASGDWILILDADESMAPEDVERIAAEMELPDALSYQFEVVDADTHEVESFQPVRLFRNAPGIFFQGIIGESCKMSLESFGKTWRMNSLVSKASIHHHWRRASENEQKEKMARHFSLMEQALQQSPDDVQLLFRSALELKRGGEVNQAVHRFWLLFHKLIANPGGIDRPCLHILLEVLFEYLNKQQDYAPLALLLDSSLARQDGITSSHGYLLGKAFWEIDRKDAALNQWKLLLDHPASRELTETEWWYASERIVSAPGTQNWAYKWMANAVAAFPVNPMLKGWLAESLLLKGRIQEAMPLWRELAEKGIRESAGWACCLLLEDSKGILEESLKRNGNQVQIQDGPFFSEPAFSREFVSWWRRWQSIDPKSLQRLHSHAGKIQTMLPTAWRVISHMLASSQSEGATLGK